MKSSRSLRVGQHRVGAEEQRLPRAELARCFRRKRSHDVGDEDADHEDRRDAVDVAGGFEPAEERGTGARPARVGELQRHAGEREAHEADDHHDVQHAVQPREAPVLKPGRSAVRWASRRSSRRRPSVPAAGRAGCGAGDVAGSWLAGQRSRRICSARGSQSRVCRPPTANVTTSSAGHPPERPEQAAGTSSGRDAWHASGTRRSGGWRRDGTSGRSATTFAAAQVRLGIRDRQDVVRAVAVVALGGLRVAELRDLAVVGVEVRLGDLLVAPPALVHDLELEPLVVRARDRVRASGSRCRPAGSLSVLPTVAGVDALLELLLDAVVAACRRCRGCSPG